MRSRWLSLGVLLLLGILGYAWWWNFTRGARSLGRAVAMVTISEKRTDCTVMRSDTKSGHNVPCNEVSAYLRDNLHVDSGAFVGIAVTGKVSPGAQAALSKDLSMNGFKVAGVIRIGFIKEPRGAR